MDKNGMVFVSFREALRGHIVGWKPLCFLGSCPGWTNVRVDGNH